MTCSKQSRKELQPLIGKEVTVWATLKLFGLKSKNSKKGASITLLLENLKVKYGNIVVYTGHNWVNAGLNIKDLGVTEGSLIKFNAVVGTYQKGKTKKKQEDIKLFNVYDIEIVELNKFGRTFKEFIYCCQVIKTIPINRHYI